MCLATKWQFAQVSICYKFLASQFLKGFRWVEIIGLHSQLGLWLVMVLLLGAFGHLLCSLDLDPSYFPLLWLRKEAPDWQAICNGCWCQASCHSLDTDTFHHYLPCQYTILGATLRQMLICHGEYVEVRCVTPATHVSCVHQSENKVLCTRACVALFLELLFTPELAVNQLRRFSDICTIVHIRKRT